MLNTFVAQCFISLIHVQSTRKLAWGAISLQINIESLNIHARGRVHP